MTKCLKCGKKCEEHYRYCKDCYSDYYIGDCDVCSSPIYCDGKDSYVRDRNKGIYHLDCFIKLKNYVLKNDNDDEKININKKKFIIEPKLVREKRVPTYRAEDGHLLRSISEITIDNYLFNHNIRHIVEKVLIDPSTSQELTCDFYLPDYDVYIEYWGMEDKEDYRQTKEWKLPIYNNLKVNLESISFDDLSHRLDYVFDNIILKYKK